MTPNYKRLIEVVFPLDKCPSTPSPKRTDAP